MRLVKVVIGMVNGLIQAVMRVPRIQVTPNGGNNPIVVDTQPQQPAKTTQKRKPSVAQPTTQGKSRKPVPTTAKPKPTQRGKQQATPAQPTYRHAKQAPKRKP